MGTRGLFGFYYHGKFYVIYNHFDSYPSGLGVTVVKQIQRANIEKWKQMLGQIRVVGDSDQPTFEDIEHLQKYTNTIVSSQSVTDWYCLLRGCQGSIEAVLESGYILNHVDSDGSPEWEDYAYIVNFDTNKLDFYVGSFLTESYDFGSLPDWEEHYSDDD